MKRIIYAGLLLAMLAACKKSFLDVTQQGAITPEDVTTPSTVDGLVLAAYAWEPHEAIINQKMEPWLADIKSDDAYKGGGGLTDQTAWYQWEVFTLTTPSVDNNDGIWYGQYEGVSRVNTALRALAGIDESAYPLKTQRIAEMRFLRGYMFMQLKRWYKWIPYFDETVTNDSIAKIPNHPDTATSDLFIWQHILDDLTAAAQDLPTTQADQGRATKYAAEGEAAYVLMWMAYEEDASNKVININQARLTQAMTYLDDIINSNQFGLAPDFANNFLTSFDGSNSEIIWEWKYSYDDGTLNGNTNAGTPLNAPWWPPYFSCCDFHKASYTMVNAFRVDANGLPLYTTYNDAEITDKNTYFNGNTWDPRISHTVAIPGLPWKYQTNILFDSTGSRTPDVYGYMNSLKENVQTSDEGLVNLFWMYNAKNESAVRYDRVLLEKAEILIQLGREAEALPIINQIRQRAANSQSLLVFANGQPSLPYKISLYQDGVNCTWNNAFAWQALQWEDRLEFAMEGERWYDLVRWGIAADALNTYFAKEMPRGRGWMKDGHFTAGRDEYMPIPQPQMNYSYGVYKQNPGY
ncbi:MAG TPA: RagB/SusD family nutrient uptake outer membrane protein [Dinghuibacter sp.]|uniref:RagB/SusD family nutrient uptake outer membrane protein n=1 Tax=Dinghuibacter sp. TaxID=2024697 RepID=UPI002C0157F1|nr:RagB/SusD family nutrient uptake outer membrane protein [Dinghuibacter sp.]HTJ12599.1 RagB/SusD family nutrient uptake outer membrane protein [Dinghuibacter sp.]